MSCGNRNNFDEASHYLNHLCFSPSGQKFMLFHLWTNEEGQRDGRLVTANIDGSDVRAHAQEIRASHYCWISDDKILLTGLNAKKRFGYYVVNLKNNTVAPYAKDVLLGDGHPSIISSERILTDTYPSETGFQSLLVYSDKNKTIKGNGQYYMPLKYKKELRCDLHPRLSYDKDNACIDMVYKNRRAMCILPIN